MTSLLSQRRLSGGLLSQMLEDPQLALQLRALPAPVLRQVILRVGLEDAAELIELSTSEQLREVFDEDLWRSPQQGQDEAFDAARFVIWLEVMLEAGGDFVADRLAELSEDFLVFAISQLVRVLDSAVIAASISDPSEADLLDKVLDAQLCQEIDGYLLVSRIENGWDAVLSTLLALDEGHSELLRVILRRCSIVAHEQVEDAGGLYRALGEEELLLEDARAEREERRAGRGYISPADARAFLGLARAASDSPERDPITRAYFRDRKPDPAPAEIVPPGAAPSRPPRLRWLLAEAGIAPDAPETAPATRSLFQQTLQELFEHEPSAHQRMVEELAYLANVLVAGDTSAARSWRPVEAAERVLDVCDEGLRSIVDRGQRSDSAATREELLRWGAIGVFRVAWASRGAAS